MIDGTKISYRLLDAQAWKQTANLSFPFLVDEDTGERIPKRKSKHQKARQDSDHYKTYVGKIKFEEYELILRESHKEPTPGNTIIGHYLNIEGSLHKNYYSGANHAPFTWNDLQREIDHLEQSLKLEPEKAKFDNLETGVNILLHTAPFPFIQKNIILFKGRAFREYEPDDKGIVLGYHCPITQFELKVYDKGLQSGCPYHLMRVELRYTKMEIPNRVGIHNLADLKDKKKVNRLLPLLLAAWDDVLMYDYDIDIDNPELSKFQRDLLLNGKDRTYWEILKLKNIRQFNDHRQKFRKLVTKYGNGYHSIIREQIEKEWHLLMNNESTLLQLTKPKMYILTVKVKCQNVHSRKCASCGRDIFHQSLTSKYCSEYRLGKDGKRCRNNGSNPRNNWKWKVIRLKKRGLLFDIIPFFKEKPA